MSEASTSDSVERGETGSPILIVGVEASAGGLEAFKELLSVLPADTGMAFLLVRHLDPTHRSLLPEPLTPRCKRARSEAEQGVRIDPNTVYTTALAVARGRIDLSAPTL